MEIDHFRYAIAAADQGSFRRAAKALGVRESSVSRRIRQLEDELSIQLFERRVCGVKLTDAGERFIARARVIVDQISSCKNAVHRQTSR